MHKCSACLPPLKAGGGTPVLRAEKCERSAENAEVLTLLIRRFRKELLQYHNDLLRLGWNDPMRNVRYDQRTPDVSPLLLRQAGAQALGSEDLLLICVDRARSKRFAPSRCYTQKKGEQMKDVSPRPQAMNCVDDLLHDILPEGWGLDSLHSIAKTDPYRKITVKR